MTKQTKKIIREMVRGLRIFDDAQADATDPEWEEVMKAFRAHGDTKGLPTWNEIGNFGEHLESLI